MMPAVETAPIPWVPYEQFGLRRRRGNFGHRRLPHMPRLTPTVLERQLPRAWLAARDVNCQPHHYACPSRGAGLTFSRRISKLATTCRAFPNDQRLPVGHTVDKDLWQVLELASDDELLLLADILYSQSLLSPLLKNLVEQPPVNAGAALPLSAMAADARQVAARLRTKVVAAGGQVTRAGEALGSQVGELAERTGSTLLQRLAGWQRPGRQPSGMAAERPAGEEHEGSTEVPRETAAEVPAGEQPEPVPCPQDQVRPTGDTAHASASPEPDGVAGYVAVEGADGADSGELGNSANSGSASASSVPAWRLRAQEDLAHGRRIALMSRLDERLRFLAAGALETVSGREPSYRDLLLSLRRKLGIGAPQGGYGGDPSAPDAATRLAVAELEAEVFQHLLRAELAAMGDPDVDAALLQGSTHVPDVQVAADIAHEREAEGALPWEQSLREGGWARTLASGGAAVVLGGAKKTLRGLALRKLESIALKKVAVKAAAALASPAGLLSIAGRLMWVLFVADLAVRAVGTDYSRVERAVFLLGKIRLTTSYGWTNGPLED
eukprot:jgi/Mesvir1/29519/Mv07017-RA.1